MNYKKKLVLILGIIAFSIPIKLYYTPPTDFDGGPMMAYNFLFLFPLSILSILLSIIIIFRLKDFKDDIFSKIVLIISIIPTLILTIFIILNIYRISNEPKNFNLEQPNNEVALSINDSLKIELNGLTNIVLDGNGDYTNKKVVNLLAYTNGKYKYKEGVKFTSISSNPKIAYKIKHDSLIIYKQDYEFSYFYETRKGIPIRIDDIRDTQLSMEELERLKFKMFIWK